MSGQVVKPHKQSDRANRPLVIVQDTATGYGSVFCDHFDQGRVSVFLQFNPCVAVYLS